MFLLFTGIVFAFNLQINSGWNLISVPVELGNESAAWLCEQVNCSLMFAYYGGKWLSYNPNRAVNSLDEINETLGLWVKAEDGVVLGDNLRSVEISYSIGWNLVGYPSLEVKNVENVYDMGKVDKIFMFNNTWRDISQLYPGYGYWVKANESFILEFNVNNAPTVDNIWINGQDIGASVDPKAGDIISVKLEAEVSDDDGYEDIISVSCDITGPGTVQDSPVTLENLSNVDPTTDRYNGSFTMDYYDLAGAYTVNCTASDGSATGYRAEEFIYQNETALELDVAAINFGSLEVLGIGNVTGDEDINTEAPTIKNAGNSVIDVDISGTNLTDADKRILVENVKYRFDDGVYSVLTGTPFNVDLNLAIDDLNKMDLSLFVPGSTVQGSYNGSITISAVK